MADPETIYNWRRLDDRVTTSGQPTEPQLADIEALGVRHVVNLALHTHESFGGDRCGCRFFASALPGPKVLATLHTLD
jgi:hypothetical protein